LSDFKGVPMLIVNTASDCGYTNQYEGLQTLFHKKGNALIVLGFPSNDFKEQERGTDEEIAQFCKLNYGVTFPIMKKSSVLHSQHQNAIFEWLSNPEKNGWCNQAPTWNFCKYVIDKDGTLTHFYDAKTDPSAINI
jgi:glutathione peroxidase